MSITKEELAKVRALGAAGHAVSLTPQRALAWADEIERLESERDKFRGWDMANVGDLVALSDELTTFKAKLAKAIEALEFYADTNNYDAPIHGEDYSDIEVDRGVNARAALAKLKEKP